MKNLPQTDIYAVLSSAHCLGRGNIETARSLLEAGVKIIQYREKDFPMRRKYEECLEIKRLCLRHDACFIVNDNAGLAVSCDANGLHIGQEDLPPEAARKVIGEDRLLGLSVTTREEVDLALKNPAIDYLGVGPIFATATKPDAAAPGGIDLMKYALSRSPLPVVAIGGITRDNIGLLAVQGAACFAIISDLIGSEDLHQRVAEFRDRLSINK
jgi:thiamine-phosphate pyrophosphorylase